jgi:hypothetical protein
MKFRVISVSTTDGSLLDIAEFPNIVDALAWKNSGRFLGSVHTIVINISASDPSMHFVMNSEWVGEDR